jgi:hypothetical protein
MQNILGSVARGIVGGTMAVLLVGVLWGFRTWWHTLDSFASSGLDIGPILRPEYGVAGLVVFGIGFGIAWK